MPNTGRASKGRDVVFCREQPTGKFKQERRPLAHLDDFCLAWQRCCHGRPRPEPKWAAVESRHVAVAVGSEL